MRKHGAFALMATAGAIALSIQPGVSVASPPMPDPPNVIFILLDDVSENLLPYMSEVSALAADGVTFENYFNVTPWCCPSRASTQTGQYPHNTHVLTNGWPNGGFGRFLADRDGDVTVATALHDAGYRTGLMGKYLNQYEPTGRTVGTGGPPSYSPNYVPPGWDTWMSGDAYQGFAYTLTTTTVGDGTPRTVRTRGAKPKNYFTDKMAEAAVDFVDSPDPAPFFLMLAPWAAHQNFGTDPEGSDVLFGPAPRDRAVSARRPAAWPAPEFTGGDCGPVACAQVPWPDTTRPENYNVLVSGAPAWMPTVPLTAAQVDASRAYHIQRIQMLQSVNDMIRSLRAQLADDGHAADTWIFVSSDNGFHLGEHGLPFGKTSALDHDVEVPLIVYPPGGTPAATVSAPIQNVDLFPTIAAIGKAAVPGDIDGVSLLPWFDTGPPSSWRTVALLELTSGKMDQAHNPDTVAPEDTSIAPTYNALRTPDYLYVDYSKIDATIPSIANGEFYDLVVDPGMLHNIYRSVSDADRGALNAKLVRYTRCAGASCISEGLTYPAVDTISATRESITAG